MASIFSDRDDVRCQHYARFAAHLDRAHFDIIYWVLFMLVIILLFSASWRYGRSVEAAERYAHGSPEHKRKMLYCMYVCSVYAAISVVAVVMEVYALMALQFCDGEDLMSLYWSTWTVMQIGSLIAIFGIVLAVFHNYCGRKHPPWALALGTPVLVVAGLGHTIQAAMYKNIKSRRSRSISRQKRETQQADDLAMSTAETIGNEEFDRDTPGEPGENEYHYKAQLLGYTTDGATILQFCQSPTPLNPLLSPTAQARIIGTNTDGQVIVALRRGKAVITTVGKPEDAHVPPSVRGAEVIQLRGRSRSEQPGSEDTTIAGSVSPSVADGQAGGKG